MKQIFTALLLVFCFACTTRGDMPKDAPNKHRYCTDTRDGEKFSFWTKTVTNIDVGYFGADTCADITDDDGKKRTLCKSHELFLKCTGD